MVSNIFSMSGTVGGIHENHDQVPPVPKTWPRSSLFISCFEDQLVECGFCEGAQNGQQGCLCKGDFIFFLGGGRMPISCQALPYRTSVHRLHIWLVYKIGLKVNGFPFLNPFLNSRQGSARSLSTTRRFTFKVLKWIGVCSRGSERFIVMGDLWSQCSKASGIWTLLSSGKASFPSLSISWVIHS